MHVNSKLVVSYQSIVNIREEISDAIQSIPSKVKKIEAQAK